MSMPNSEYWKQRFTQLEAAQNAIGENAKAEIERIYRDILHTIEGQITAWYERLAKNNDISMAEAKKRLRGKELKEFHWDVGDYIKYAKENAMNKAWVKELENASAKFHISRLEGLKINLEHSLQKLFHKEESIMTDALSDVYKEGYYRTMYELQKGFSVGFDVAKIDDNYVHKVLSKPWAADGYNFSERIWKNKTQLINTVHQIISQNVLTGADPRKAIDAIAAKMKTSKYNAGRLVMTEEAYFSSLATSDCYKELDVEKYEILATLDNRTSDICQSMDGKVFDMKDYQAGVTAPPFHCFCRSTTVPAFDKDYDITGSRAARNGDGKTYYVDGDMRYSEWKKVFVDKEMSYKDWQAKSAPKASAPAPKTESKAKTEPKITYFKGNTVEEAQEYAKKFISDGFSPTFKNQAVYKGISVEHANEINGALEEIYAKYDIPKINGIKVISPTSAQGKKAFKDGSDAIMSYSPTEKGIYINKDILKDAKALEKYNQKSEEAYTYVITNIDALKGAQKELALTYKNAGRSLIGNGSVGDHVRHEVGHHVQWQELPTELNNSMGKNMSKYAPKISGYANASKGEYIAESFAAYDKGERDILDPDFVAYMDKKSAETIDKSVESGIIKVDKVFSGHSGTPKKYKPNTVADHVTNDGIVDKRSFYGDDALKSKDIHTTDHKQPNQHKYGEHGEHAHDYEWDNEEKLKNKTTRELTEDERRENGDIL